MSRLAPTSVLSAVLAALVWTSAFAQPRAPQPQPALPGMMGQMLGAQHPMHQMMTPGAPAAGGAQAPAAADPHQHGAAAPSVASAGSAVSSTAAFMAANETMHRDMAITYTGDTDRDFAASMIPHHQGAIAMARVQLAQGRDPAMRTLAEAVISAQESEIATLRAFLSRPR